MDAKEIVIVVKKDDTRSEVTITVWENWPIAKLAEFTVPVSVTVNKLWVNGKELTLF